MTIESAEAYARQPRWQELSTITRALLEGKLIGLYEQADDESSFDALAIDKQQSLLIFARRLNNLNLWSSIRRIENVYGEGGVGISFSAWPLLESSLRRRIDFTAKFAAHKDASIGFLERGRTKAALHFLRARQPEPRSFWSAHFDLYSPLAFPLGTWQHLLSEKLRGETPDWRRIKQALEYEKEETARASFS